jgi:hypothetical protein
MHRAGPDARLFQGERKVNQQDVLTHEEAAKYFAGCALNGFCSEVRMGKNLNERDMRDMAARAAFLGKLLADMMA